jgi:hypothetical protein
MSISAFLTKIENESVLENNNFIQKIKDAGEVIKKFIIRVVDWIKTKIYNFFKMNAVNVNKKLYYECKSVLSKLDKIDIRLTEDGFSFSTKNIKAGDWDVHLSEIKKIIERIRDSEEYNNIIFNNYDSDDIISFKPNSLHNEIEKVSKDLDVLKKHVNNKASIDNMQSDMFGEERVHSLDHYLVDTLQIKMHIMNKLIEHSRSIKS